MFLQIKNNTLRGALNTRKVILSKIEFIANLMSFFLDASRFDTNSLLTNAILGFKIALRILFLETNAVFIVITENKSISENVIIVEFIRSIIERRFSL